MKLKTVTITEFKSIKTSQPFDVTDITCLVGKNEAGKTGLLEALYRLNPVVESDGKFDVTDDYPRNSVEEYQIAVEQKKRTHATVATAVFILEDDDLDGIHAQFGEGVIAKSAVAESDELFPLLTLSKGYSNELEHALEVHEAATAKVLADRAKLPGPMSAEASACTTLAQLSEYLEKKSEAQAKAYQEALAAAEKIEDAQKQAQAKDEAKSLAETEGAKQLRTLLDEVLEEGLSEYIFGQHLEDRIPTFLYFDEYYRMSGADKPGQFLILSPSDSDHRRALLCRAVLRGAGGRPRFGVRDIPGDIPDIPGQFRFI